MELKPFPIGVDKYYYVVTHVVKYEVAFNKKMCVIKLHSGGLKNETY